MFILAPVVGLGIRPVASLVIITVLAVCGATMVAVIYTAQDNTVAGGGNQGVPAAGG